MSELEYIPEEERNDFFAWLRKGVENKWITYPFCSTHEGDPYMSEEEMTEWDEGGDPCCLVSKYVRGVP